MVDFDEILNTPLADVFGMSGTVVPASGETSFTATFSVTRTVSSVDGQQTNYATSENTLFCRQSALPQGRRIRQRDRIELATLQGVWVVTVAGVPDVDETGWMALALYDGRVPNDV